MSLQLTSLKVMINWNLFDLLVSHAKLISQESLKHWLWATKLDLVQETTLEIRYLKWILRINEHSYYMFFCSSMKFLEPLLFSLNWNKIIRVGWRILKKSRKLIIWDLKSWLNLLLWESMLMVKLMTLNM